MKLELIPLLRFLFETFEISSFVTITKLLRNKRGETFCEGFK